MAIKNFLITGDTHGRVAERIGNIAHNSHDLLPEETAVIILGDAGFNYWLNDSDTREKRRVCKYGYTIYCVRGNHEERPENLNYEKSWDDDVQGEVYVDPVCDLIRYFIDGEVYVINGHRTLVIGGAYSVDKHYRLQRAAAAGQSFSGWFKDEQLSDWEVQAIAYNRFGEEYDFVFTHTCPLSWEPTDLFLGCIDQSTVDKSTEMFLDEVRQEVSWKIWCFGHYHADRLERPRVEQFYTDWENLDAVWNRWYDEKTVDTEWWLQKSPNYYMEDDAS